MSQEEREQSRIDPHWDRVATLLADQAPDHFVRQHGIRSSELRDGLRWVTSPGTLMGLPRDSWDDFVAVSDLYNRWDWTPFEEGVPPDAFDFLSEAMRINRDLEVEAYGGLFDLNVAFRGIEQFASRFDADQQRRITVRTLPSSHAPYMDAEQWEPLRERIGMNIGIPNYYA